MKVCNKCKVTKPLEEYFRDKKNLTDGRYSICKLCKNEATSNWRKHNKDTYNEAMRAYSKKNRQKIHYQSTYGMTLEQYKVMFDRQDGKCWICKLPQKGKRPLVVDHSHESDKVRGLLCYGCNRALHVLENKELLKVALSYLEYFK